MKDFALDLSRFGVTLILILAFNDLIFLEIIVLGDYSNPFAIAQISNLMYDGTRVCTQVPVQHIMDHFEVYINVSYHGYHELYFFYRGSWYERVLFLFVPFEPRCCSGI